MTTTTHTIEFANWLYKEVHDEFYENLISFKQEITQLQDETEAVRIRKARSIFEKIINYQYQNWFNPLHYSDELSESESDTYYMPTEVLYNLHLMFGSSEKSQKAKWMKKFLPSFRETQKILDILLNTKEK